MIPALNWRASSIFIFIGQRLRDVSHQTGGQTVQISSVIGAV